MARATALWMLYLARVIDGATAGNISLAQAYISDNTDPKDRTKSFALIGIAFGLGFFDGPLPHRVPGQVSAQRAHLRGVGHVAHQHRVHAHAAPAQRAAPGRRAKRRRQGPRVSASRSSSSTDLRAIFRAAGLATACSAQFFFYMLGFSTFTSGFALFAERRFTWNGHPFTPREIGFVLVLRGCSRHHLARRLIGRLVKRFGEPALVSSGFVSLIVAYIILGPIGDIAGSCVVSTISSFGNGVLRPTLSEPGLAERRAARAGVVLGLNQSLNSVAQIVAPIVGGILIGRGHAHGVGMGRLCRGAHWASRRRAGGRRWCPKQAPEQQGAS